MENLTPIFIAVTGAAVLLQACLLAAMYLAMRKTTARMESLASDVAGKALPALETAQSILTEIRPKLQVICADELLTRTLDRVEQTSDMVHSTVISPVRQVSGIVRGVTAGIEF